MNRTELLCIAVMCAALIVVPLLDLGRWNTAVFMGVFFPASVRLGREILNRPRG